MVAKTKFDIYSYVEFWCQVLFDMDFAWWSFENNDRK